MTTRGGWHYARHPSGQWALLTAVADDAYRGGPIPPVPSLPWDVLPTELYAIAMEAAFWETVLLDRHYDRPHTCYDAVVTILKAWETRQDRQWQMTLRTINGVPCVLI